MFTIENLEEDGWGFYIDIEKNSRDEYDNCNKIYDKIIIQSTLPVIYEELDELYEKDLLNTNSDYSYNRFCCFSNVTIIGVITYILFWVF
jgi:hypothetical protein